MIHCQKSELCCFVGCVQSNPSVTAMFLSFTTNDTLVQKILCFRDHPVYCRMLSSIPGLQLLHANRILKVVTVPKCVQKLPNVLLGYIPIRGPLLKGKSRFTPKLWSFLGLTHVWCILGSHSTLIGHNSNFSQLYSSSSVSTQLTGCQQLFWGRTLRAVHMQLSI